MIALPHTPPPHPRFSKLTREMLARTTIVVGCFGAKLSGRDPSEVLKESLRAATHQRGEIRYRNVEGRGTVMCYDGAQVLQNAAESIGLDLADDHQAEVFVDYCQRCLESYKDYFPQA